MPGGDRTGPNGEGPMTGRGSGYCGGSDTPGYAGPRGYGRGFERGYGRGFRYGFGMRRGWGRGWGRPYPGGYAPNAFPRDPYFAAPLDPGSEAAFLKNQAEALKQDLEAISKRLTELEGKPE
ncbi:MAG: DUF5320 domain-containing protein [Anaerolineales bacterium]|nr:DUF5320 domain-containing protein [Anaerolineales bacterium]